ncbi:acyltransferase [Candidatus Micrarchaeota archaeon]|nr:acyltransferase [Candidatus Micrarchaeota archaeon]
MMRRIEKIAYKKGDWWFWLKHKNPIRVLFNAKIAVLVFFCPIPSISGFLLGLTGMKVGKNAFIALGNVFDIFYPELVEIGDNAIIGTGCMITAHELIQEELRIGRIRIGNDAVVGARSVVLPGIEIGNNAIVGAMSLVNRDVPDGEKHAGIPARRIG